MASPLDFQGFGPVLLGLMEDLYGPLSQINADELIREAGGLGKLFSNLNSIKRQLISMTPLDRQQALDSYRANYSNFATTPVGPATPVGPSLIPTPIQEFGIEPDPLQPYVPPTPTTTPSFNANLQQQMQALNNELTKRLGYVSLTFLPQSNSTAGGRITIGGASIDFTFGVNASGQLVFNNNPVTDLQGQSPIERVAGFLGQVTARMGSAPMVNQAVSLETGVQAAKGVTNQFFGGGPQLSNLSVEETERLRAQARAAGYEFNQRNLQEHPEWFRQAQITDETGKQIGAGGYLYARDRGHVTGAAIEDVYAAAHGAMITRTPTGELAFLNWKSKQAFLPNGQPDPAVLSKFNKALQDSGAQDVVRLRYSDTGELLPVVRSPIAQENVLGERIVPDEFQLARVAFTTGRMPAGMGVTVGRPMETVEERPYTIRGKADELTPERIFQGEVVGRRQGYALAPGYARDTGDWERTQVSMVPGSYQVDEATGMAQAQMMIRRVIETEGSTRIKSGGHKAFLAGQAPQGAFGVAGEYLQGGGAGGVPIRIEGANIITSWENVKNIPGQMQMMIGAWLVKHPEAAQQYGLLKNEQGEVRWVEENLPGLRALGREIITSPESYSYGTFAPQMMVQANRVWADRRTRIGPEMMARIRAADPEAYERIATESQPIQEVYQQVLAGGMYAAGRNIGFATRPLSEVAAGAMGAAGANVGDIGRPNVQAILGGLRLAQEQLGISERTMLTAEFRRGPRAVRAAASLRTLEYVSGQEFQDDLAGIEDETVRRSLMEKASVFTGSFSKLVMAQASGVQYPEEILDNFLKAQNALLGAREIYRGALSYYPKQAISSPAGADPSLPKNVYAISNKHLGILAKAIGMEGTAQDIDKLSTFLAKESVAVREWRDPSISSSQTAPSLRLRAMKDFGTLVSDKDFIHPILLSLGVGDADGDRYVKILSGLGLKFERGTGEISYGGPKAQSEKEFLSWFVAENKRMGGALSAEYVKAARDRWESINAKYTDPQTGQTLTGPVARFAQEIELMGTRGAFTAQQIQAGQARGVTHQETMGKVFNMMRRLMNLSGLDERAADAMLAPYQSPLDKVEYSQHMGRFMRIAEGYQPATAGLGPGLLGEGPEFFGLFKGDVMGGGMMAMQEALSSFLLAPENARLVNQIVPLIAKDPRQQEMILKSLANAQRLNDPRILGFGLAAATGGQLWSETERFGVLPQTLKAFMAGRWKESKLPLPENMKEWARLGAGLQGGTEAMSGRFWLPAQAEGMDPMEALLQTAAGLEEHLGRAAFNEKQRAIMAENLRRAGLPTGVSTEKLADAAAGKIGWGGENALGEQTAFINKQEADLLRARGQLPPNERARLDAQFTQQAGGIPSFQEAYPGAADVFKPLVAAMVEPIQQMMRSVLESKSEWRAMQFQEGGQRANLLGRMQLAFAGRGEMPAMEEFTGQFFGSELGQVGQLQRMFFGRSGARSPEALQLQTAWLSGKVGASLGNMEPALATQLDPTTPEGAANLSRAGAMQERIAATRGRMQFHWTEAGGIAQGPDVSGMSEQAGAGLLKAQGLYTEAIKKSTEAMEKYGGTVGELTGAEQRRLERYEKSAKMTEQAMGLYAQADQMPEGQREYALARAGALTQQAQQMTMGRGPQTGALGKLLFGPTGDEGLAGWFGDLSQGRGKLGQMLRGGQLISGMQMFALSRMERMFVDPALSAAMQGGAEEQLLGTALARGGYGYGGLGTAQQAVGAYTGMQMAYQRQAAATWSPVVRGVSEMMSGGAGGPASILGPAVGAGLAGAMIGGMFSGGNPLAVVATGGAAFAGTAITGALSRQQYLAENPDFADMQRYMAWKSAAENQTPILGTAERLWTMFSAMGDRTVEGGALRFGGAERGAALAGVAERGLLRGEMEALTPRQRATAVSMRAQQLATQYNIDQKAAADVIAQNAILFGGGPQGEATLVKAMMSGVNIEQGAQLSARLGGGGAAQYAQQWAGYAEMPAQFGLAVTGMQSAYAGQMAVAGLAVTPAAMEGFAGRTIQQQTLMTNAFGALAGTFQQAQMRGTAAPSQAALWNRRLQEDPTKWAPIAMRVAESQERANQAYDQVYSITRDTDMAKRLSDQVRYGVITPQQLSMAISTGNQVVGMTGDFAAGRDVMASVIENPQSARMWGEAMGGNANVLGMVGGMTGNTGLITRELDTGLGRFTTSFGIRQSPQLGGGQWVRTPTQMLQSMGMNPSMLTGLGFRQMDSGDFGFTNPFGQEVSGMRGLQWAASQNSFNAQMASFGAAIANIRRAQTFETGIGLGTHGMIDASGRPTGEYLTEGRGAWAVEDEMRNLQRRQQGYADVQAADYRALNLRQFREQWELTRGNYLEGWGFNRGVAQMQRGWQMEDFATRQRQMQQQRGWTREDWAFQQGQSQMQFGWQMEDVEENIRFATGRERALLERGKKRATITHDTETSRVDTLQKRQEQLWKDEDDRFSTEKKRADETFKTNIARMDMEKKQFLAQSDLSRKHFEERMGMEEENAKKQKEWMQERWEMEDYLQNLQRAHTAENEKAQIAAAGAQAGYAAKQKAINDMMMAMQDANEDLQAKLKLRQDTEWEFWGKITEKVRALIGALNLMKPENVPDMGSSPTTNTTVPNAPRAGGYHGYIPGPMNLGALGTAGEMGGEWIDIWPMNRPALPHFSYNDGGRNGGFSGQVIVMLDGQEISGHMEVRTERSLYQGRLR